VVVSGVFGLLVRSGVPGKDRLESMDEWLTVGVLHLLWSRGLGIWKQPSKFKGLFVFKFLAVFN
jgi:hypothetical protein